MKSPTRPRDRSPRLPFAANWYENELTLTGKAQPLYRFPGSKDAAGFSIENPYRLVYLASPYRYLAVDLFDRESFLLLAQSHRIQLELERLLGPRSV